MSAPRTPRNFRCSEPIYALAGKERATSFDKLRTNGEEVRGHPFPLVVSLSNHGRLRAPVLRQAQDERRWGSREPLFRSW
jgi:hypothetical protein